MQSTKKLSQVSTTVLALPGVFLKLSVASRINLEKPKASKYISKIQKLPLNTRKYVPKCDRGFYECPKH